MDGGDQIVVTKICNRVSRFSVFCLSKIAVIIDRFDP